MSWIKRIAYYFCIACKPRKSKTVRYAFSLTFIAAAALSAAALLIDTESYIRIESSEKTIESGKTFAVDVYAGAHVPVNAVNISLSYPEDQVTVSGIDVGRSVITIWAQDPYVDGDTVVLQGGTFRKGFLGEHLIATINFKALHSGRAEFSIADIDLLAGDGTGDSVSVTDLDQNSLAVYVANEDGSLEGVVDFKISTDIDGDGNVGFDDVQTFMSAWSSRVVLYDFNDDSKMNFTDFAIILANSFTR